MQQESIYEWVKSEESAFLTDKVKVGDNWEWSWRDHVQLIFHLKNGVFFTGLNDYLRSFKNIMEPLLNLAYWTEDLEVKDVVFYVENEVGRAVSFLVKKYHDEIYVKEHNLDTLFDEITESDLDYGGVIVQTEGEPEVLQLNTVAFCDQTDTIGSPIGFKHTFAIGALRKMAKRGWGSKANGASISIDDLIILADTDKSAAGQISGKENKTPSKQIETYIIKGELPNHYLKNNDDMEGYSYQVHIIAYYQDKQGKRQGVTLFKQEGDDDSLLFHTSKKVYGRGLGRGVGESLIHPQLWTNWLEIHKNSLIEAASKVPLVTDDAGYSNRNRIQDMENLEITVVEDGKTISQVPTAAPANIALFENQINTWFQHAQLTGAAFDPILGKEQASGTTFRGQERTVAQGRGIHDRRRGQRAKFIEEIYRRAIVPDIVRQIRKGKKFLSTLTAEEMQWVGEMIANRKANEFVLDRMLEFARGGASIAGLAIERDLYKQKVMEEFGRGGNKKMLKLIGEELKGAELKMGINIAGKQKDLVNLSDKLLSIFQFVFANPQAFQQSMQIPALAKSFNSILEFSGMNQADFYSFMSQNPAQAQPQEQNPQQTLALNKPTPVVA